MIAEVDKSLYPIIIIKTLPVEISDTQLEDYLKMQEELLQEATQKIIFIYDTNNSRYLSGDQTVRISKWSKIKEQLFKEKCLGTCIVTSSVLSNLIVRIIKSLLKSRFEAKVFSNMDNAIKWASEQLKAAK